MQCRRYFRLRAFTLIELAVVVLILGLLTAGAMRYVNSTNDAKYLAATNATLDVIETALQNYRNTYGRIPCPADLTQAELTTAFGTEVYTTAVGDGTCNNAAGTTNYVNSGTDPDASGNPGAPDPLYDSTNAPSNVVEGAVPTKALRIADKYAYDAWGNKIFYAVDKRLTAIAPVIATVPQANAFAAYPITNTAIGVIVIKSIPYNTTTYNYATYSTLANALTYKAIYALVSTGKNGHGGFARNLTATSVRFNAGSTNTDEQTNCHCNSSGVAQAFNRIFIQKAKTNDSTSFSDNFDDIVRFKTRVQMANYPETQ